MGRKERREREAKRENYATRHSAEKRKNMLIAIGILCYNCSNCRLFSLGVHQYDWNCARRDPKMQDH